MPSGREPVFAQRYHPPQGRDRKIHAIGGRLFGVKKVFPSPVQPFLFSLHNDSFGRAAPERFRVELAAASEAERSPSQFAARTSWLPPRGLSRTFSLFLCISDDRWPADNGHVVRGFRLIAAA